MKDKIKVGRTVLDDMNLLYRVVEVFKLSCVLEPLPNDASLSCEIMTFEAMEREGWSVPNV